MELEGNSFLGKLTGRSDIILAVAVIAIIGVLVIPIPPGLLDFALAFNITFSLVILLSTLYIRRPLDLSVFPGMLLIVTLLRLALNVASTRLILGTGYAGEVINSFGNFVVKGNYVVGFIVFMILVIIQFVVITKGAGRISEVAARFTLDAMPGKQMAIDADLNAGLINETEAKTRRKEIADEADFYGAMDGASKFVRGDAIAGILITMINVVGGFVIGILMQGHSVSEALRMYTLLSVGDGLVTQIPALIVSTSAGIIVTRTASTSNMGTDLAKQLTGQPRAIMIASVMLILFGIVPGMPTIPFIVLGAGVGAVGYMTSESMKKKKLEEQRTILQASQVEQPERTEDLLKVDALEVEIGYGLIPLVDTNQGGDLLERVSSIRRQLAIEMGIIVPPIRIRDNVQLNPNQYRVKVKGIEAAKYELMLDHIMAINPGFVRDELDGFRTTEPAFGMSAVWVIPNFRETAESRGYTIVEPSAVLATHLTEIIKISAPDLLSRQDVSHLMETLKEDNPSLVSEIIPNVVPLSVVQKVLQTLLSERIPIRDMATIMETITDIYPGTKETDVLAEYVRMSMKRQITEMYKDKDNKIYVFTIDPSVEQMLTDSVQHTKQGLMLVTPPAETEKLIKAIGKQMGNTEAQGRTPICLSSPNIRLALKRLAEATYPSLVILSYNEISNNVEVISNGIVGFGNDN
ncbi:MAG: flagellar biosynthesis protein FlhA [candidate division Zixibacteria bacterium HGW-Zixibacteria-1]|nr:MAG: flagellar biosynthesis protein FlhA [candidate division Zixibacteria bacterium HGW-Zixibacteria-1]